MIKTKKRTFVGRQKCVFCCVRVTKRSRIEVKVSKSSMDQFDKLEFVGYLTALTVYVAPQWFKTSTLEKPASSNASISCFTVRGVS